MSEAGKDSNGKTATAPGNRRLGNRAIGDRLRKMYEGVVEEPVPEDFIRLLEEAERNELASAAPDTSQKQ